MSAAISIMDTQPIEEVASPQVDKGKEVLLSQAQADLKNFVVKDSSHGPAMAAINVTSAYCEANNSHLMLRVPHPSFDVAEFPSQGNDHAPVEAGKSVLITPATLEKALKNTSTRSSSLPILATVKLGINDKGNPVLVATDLDTTVSFEQRAIEGEYPDTDQVIPDASTPHVFSCSAAYLKLFCDWAIRNGNGRDPIIHFHSSSPTAPILLTIPMEDAQQATGVLMPKLRK